MSPVKRITILELAPCADTLLGIRHDADEGYVSAEADIIRIRSGARLRPVLLSINAGGKATNVARVIDKLVRPADPVEIDLVVFRPDSPEGNYLAELQASSLDRVRVRSVIVDSTARFCINLSDPASRAPSRVEFNLSPRVLWQPSAIDVALQTARGLDTDLLVLAGNPPVVAPDCSMAADLPSSIIEQVPGNPAVSVDIEKGTLARCIDGHPRPDVIKINREEFASVDGQHWRRYNGVLVVTDEDGCTVWGRGPSGPGVEVDAAQGHPVYSTVGAGDATHAGFTVARWVWGFDLVRAARYGMAAAAASVSSPEGARGVEKEAVERFFAELEAGTEILRN
jgi:fructose-1-phosphate kinase PfkB-like protein